MNPIEQTPLFLSVAPLIKSISKDELRDELIKAALVSEVRWQSKTIDTAITWDYTPQGHAFWSRLHTETGLR